MIRIMVFTDRSDCIMVFAPDAEPVDLPELTPPFTKYSVAKACGDAGVLVRVSEAPTGRWTTAAVQARRAEGAERGQRERQREATEAVMLRGSASGDVRDRAAAIQEKHRVDEKLRGLKVTLGEAKAKAARERVFMAPAKYRAMEREIDALKQESLALQTKIGELRDAEKHARKAEKRTEAEAFKMAACKILEDETISRILALADEMTSDDEEAAGAA